MAYLSLYRKYRSQSFEEVSGQDHVTRTLQNAIRTGRIAHAYLFCGPRGTGKTSTARLLAKALNCRRSEGPTPEPCNECSACTQIAAGSFLDLREIDAASNRGIDEMRDLRDNVAYTPAEGRYKVYVIDEVHQLTLDAFNALLKTLEEPPPHVVFILATTEAHKIPATIVSRCQRFEFRRATMDHLRERVAYVTEQEGFQIEPAALDLIARDANGGWRDALSLLEQVLAFSEGAVTAKDVYSVLGTVEADALFQLVECIHGCDGAQVWRMLEELVASGKDPRQLLRDLTSHFRALMLAASGCPPSGSPDDVARLNAQARAFGQTRLIAAIELLAQTDREARWSEQPRLLVEVAVARLMQPARIGWVEVEAEAPEAPRSQPTRPQPAAAAPRPAPAPPRQPERPAAPAAASPFADEASPAKPAANGNGTATPGAFGGGILPPPPLTVGDARTGRDDDDDDFDFGDPPPVESVEPPVAPKPAPRPQPAAPAPPVQPVQPPAPAPASQPAVAGSFDVEPVRRKWRLVGEELKRSNKRTIEACLVESQPDRFEGDTLVISFPSQTMADLFTQRGKAFSEPLVQALQKVAGVTCRVRAEVRSAGGSGPSGAPARSPSSGAAPARPQPTAREAAPTASPFADEPSKAKPAPASSRPPAPAPTPTGAGGDELMHNVLEVFDGQVVDARDFTDPQ